jgi:hypothetical protein
MKVIAVVILALAVTATAAASFDPRYLPPVMKAENPYGIQEMPVPPSGRSQGQDLGLIPGGGLNVDNPKSAVPWGGRGNVWQTVTRNTVCRYLPATQQIRCMTRQDGFTLVLRRRSIQSNDNTVGVPRDAPVLRWGQYLKRGPFRCISRRAYLSCFNLQTKHGFELSRTLHALWNRPRWSCEPSARTPTSPCPPSDVPSETDAGG